VTRAVIEGATCAAVTNIGTRPTFEGARFAIETHLLDVGPDLYGRRVEIDFLARLRQELKFDSVQALVEQIHRDIDRARAFFAAEGAGPP
jgi:riboflavin kinase / FMN adenylyltransferase